MSKVIAIEKIEYTGDVYNLHVDGNHNYFADSVNVSNCHLAKSKSLVGIGEKCSMADYRIGTTGTLDGVEANKMTLEGIFGETFQATSTTTLMKKGELSELKIKCIVLKHPDSICKELKGIEYQKEIDYIIQNERRNLFIKNLAGSLKNNTLILFQFIERHGDILFNLLQDLGGKKIFYIHGGTSPEDREAVRIYCENNSDTIILASYGVFSTGVNIKNLDNIIFALSGKSRIRNLQSIGRGLRLHDGKTHATLIDLSDDLRSGKYVNHSLKHLQERVKTYSSEKFHYKLIPINL